MNYERKPRRWNFRFSLRTLLLLMLIVGYLLAREARQYRAEKFCQTQLSEAGNLGYTYALDYRFSFLADERMQWIARRLNDYVMFRTGMINLDQNDAVSDERMDQLLNQLAYINTVDTARLDEIPLSGSRLRALKHLTRLETLSLCGASCDDQVLQAVSELSRLKGLAISRASISDAAALKLANLTSIRRIVFDNVTLAEATLRRLRKELPNTYITYIQPQS